MNALVCPRCRATLRPGQKFCAECGQPMTAPAQPPPPPGRDPKRVTPVQARISTPASTPPPRSAPPAVRPPAAAAARFTAWDLLSILGCGGVATAWYKYSSLDTAPDIQTSVAMVALPVGIVAFRRPLDRLLAKLNPLRERIPPFMRLGIGFAMPFFVSTSLYSAGYTQFDYIFKTVVASTLLSYVVLRNPAPIPSKGGVS